MTEKKFIKIVSTILKKKVVLNSQFKFSEIANIDSLDYVKLSLGFKKYGIILNLSDLEKLTIHEIIEMTKK